LGIHFFYFNYNIWFGNVSNCLSFEFHFEDITKFIIMVKYDNNGNNGEQDHFQHAGGDEKLIYNK
jgi:hypothetical protein